MMTGPLRLTRCRRTRQCLLGCERGGDLKLTLTLDDKCSVFVTAYSVTEESLDTCTYR